MPARLSEGRSPLSSEYQPWTKEQCRADSAHWIPGAQRNQAWRECKDNEPQGCELKPNAQAITGEAIEQLQTGDHGDSGKAEANGRGAGNFPHLESFAAACLSAQAGIRRMRLRAVMPEVLDHPVAQFIKRTVIDVVAHGGNPC